MRILLSVCLALIPALCCGAAIADDDPQPAEKYTVECSYSNPAYSGQCVVTEEVSQSVAVNDACRTILDCLNNAQCTKTYCNATTVRSGWKFVKGAKKKPASDQ